MVKKEEPCKRILVVDDMKTTLFMLRRVLSNRGYEVLEAENGREALDKFESAQAGIDIVLMDVQMPVMDGLTACREIKKTPGGRNVPVIVFTGQDDEKTVEKAFAAGAGDFVTKPINYEELGYRIKRLLYLQEVEEAVKQKAYYDQLTGLPNRLLFQDRLSVTLKKAQKEGVKSAVVLLNLRGLKYINDAFGYENGDLLIKTLAERIQELVEDENSLSCFGGDRFALVLPHIIKTENAAKITDEIIRVCTQPWQVNGDHITVNCHAGVAVYPADGESAQELMVCAETAMDLASREALSAYRFYSREMNKRAFERISLENSLSHALEQGELQLHYQPLVDAKSGRIAGAEALLRWNSPQHGPVSPARFIPLAEETGKILKIGEWVLKEACASCQRWNGSGLPGVGVSVNLSTLQFRQENLVDVVEAALAESGLRPELLKLEITESIAIEDLDFTIRKLEVFRRMGLKISMDDFGTGYSSLSYIKNLPLDELKIDVSFIRDIVVNRADRVILETIVALGRGLELSLVAEGVETAEQLALLQDMNCHRLQGYLFSKPLPEKDFLSLPPLFLL